MFLEKFNFTEKKIRNWKKDGKYKYRLKIMSYFFNQIKCLLVNNNYILFLKSATSRLELSEKYK